MTKIEPRLLKGFRDYGLQEESRRQEMFTKIQTVFEQFGFLPLSTPVLEYKEILMGKYGDDEKLVYSFKDHGDRDVAMRYDLTVPLARYVAQNQGKLQFPFKRYQIAPVWRADNPQKGRLREFYQCDVDVVGTHAPLADAEVIACLCKALEAVGVDDYTVRVNNRLMLDSLKVESIRALDKIDKIGIDGIVEEMQEKGISSEEIERVRKLVSAHSEDDLDTDMRRIFLETIKPLIFRVMQHEIKGNMKFDITIARGLDYYTGTVFEIYLNDKPDFGSICSGGRYDNLVDQFSSQSLPAVGGSIGIDRLLQALEKIGSMKPAQKVQALILNMDEKYVDAYINLASNLRDQGINVELYYIAAKLDKQFKYAESKHIPYAIIIGEAEIASGTAQVKNLQTRTQEEVSLDDLRKYLTSQS